jgi:adenine-specific DNA methylase
MRFDSKKPTVVEVEVQTKKLVTKKFHIEVPLDEYENTCCIYRIYFGKKYLWWKSLTIFKGVQMIAEQVERMLRNGNEDETNYLYYVVAHIKKTRCIRATVEVYRNDIQKGGSIDALKLLKLEQQLLDSDSNNNDCLNNNADAYVPKWIEEKYPNHLREFNNWKKKRK